MGTVNQLLDLARSQIGVTSGKEYWEYFKGKGTYVDGDTTPYCAYYLSWLLAKTDTKCPYFPNGTAFDEKENLGGRGINKYDLKPGDLVAFDWDSPKDYRGDHVGVVENVYDWGCVCIEGNTNYGKVARRDRVWDVILCGLRPYYDQETSTGKWIAVIDKKGNYNWWYELSDGSYPAANWFKVEDKWYYFDKNGWLVSGWVKTNGRWYYCHQEHDGHFGEMESSKVLTYKNNFYILGEDGALTTEPKFDLEDDSPTYGSIIF